MESLTVQTVAPSPVFSVTPEKVYGSSLLRVAEVFDAVHSDTRVADLAQFFRESDRPAVGIVDPKGMAIGLVTRDQLFELLGKPFGLEVLAKRPVGAIAQRVPLFDQNDNLFHAAEILGPTMDKGSIHYYQLIDREGLYKGIFSSKDLLSWLSRMTQEDIALAGQLQERLVPARSSHQGPGWSVEAFSQSAKGLGGDFYHVIPLDQDRVFLALGDVSGKGVAASILTSLLWGVLQFYDFRKGLKKLLLQVNEALIHTFHLEKYLTGVFLVYDARQGHLTVADMGHGHSLLVRGGKVRPLRFPSLNLPLGIDLGLSPTLYRIPLSPGDMVCLYTDGLTEQVDGTGEELGDQAVWSLASRASADPSHLPERLLVRLARHQGAVPRLDDASWLQLEVK